MCSPLGKKLCLIVCCTLSTNASYTVIVWIRNQEGIRPGIWPSWLNLVIHCQAHSSSVSQHKFLLFLLRTLLWARCWLSWPDPSSPDGYTAVTSCHTQHSFPSVFPEPFPHWLQSMSDLPTKCEPISRCSHSEHQFSRTPDCSISSALPSLLVLSDLHSDLSWVNSGCVLIWLETKFFLGYQCPAFHSDCFHWKWWLT